MPSLVFALRAPIRVIQKDLSWPFGHPRMMRMNLGPDWQSGLGRFRGNPFKLSAAYLARKKIVSE
ncbi:hypothetical protein HUU05_21670 [candidate division KSB1 bacterium]|nr:hypothetical protein [candidate division KSB1 bacterium]